MRIVRSLVTGLFFLPVAAWGQEATPTKLALSAVLVLTPEFCRDKTVIGEPSETACVELEPALKDVFSSVTRASASPSIGGDKAQVVLQPRVIDVSAASAALSRRQQLTVALEWTVKDSAGRIVWIETVKGTGKGPIGTAMSYKKNQKLVVGDAVKDAAVQSASRMATAPELKKLAELVAHRMESAPASGDLNRYTLEYVHSDQVWKHAGPTTRFDDLAQVFERQMADVMDAHGFQRVSAPDRVCCELGLEIIAVTVTHSGVDVTAKVKFADGSGHEIYAKEYRAEAPGYGFQKVEPLFDRAIAAIVRGLSIDGSFGRSLTSAINGAAN